MLKKLFFVLLFSLPFNTYSQGLYPLSYFDSSSNTDFINFSFEKISQTYYFSGLANINREIFGGNFLLKQNYRSTIIGFGNSGTKPLNSYRDDERLSLEYNYPLFSHFSGSVKQNWLLSSDSRSLGNNQSERLNGLAGLKYSIDNISSFEFLMGGENSKQIGLSFPGLIFNFAGSLNEIDLNGFKLKSYTYGEFIDTRNHQQNLDRKNRDFELNANLNRQYDSLNTINFYGGFKHIKRDFLNPFGLDILGRIPLEQKIENKFDAAVDLEFSIIESVNAKANAVFYSLDVEKSYQEKVPESINSSAFRFINEFGANITGELNYFARKSSHRFIVNYSSRNEENTAKSKFGLSPVDEQELKLIENQRDNYFSKTKLYYSGTFIQSFYDTLRFDVSPSLLRYDTPSKLNNDDRDELTWELSGIYSHRFSERTQLRINCEVRALHLVYIKSQRSILNNWNRILKFEPSVVYKSTNFFMNPVISIMANYTVYDFEEISPGIKSYSFRQLSFRDSIVFKFNNEISLQSWIYTRYYESAILFWKDFSEAPQNSNFEQFFKVMCIVDKFGSIQVGSGFRLYYLNRKNLQLNNDWNKSEEQISFAPETIVNIRFSSGSFISFFGWYEIQINKGKITGKIPNFSLQSGLAL